jgi:hypothetical protein
VPFRSESEALREQIRRIGEQASELAEERSALEREIAGQKTTRRGMRRMLVAAAAVLAVVATSLVGFVAGDLAADKRARDARDRREQRQSEEIGAVLLAARECSDGQRIAESDLVLCVQERADAKRRSEMKSSPTTRGLR